jgi:V8-like Glu-specific endopeptidase
VKSGGFFLILFSVAFGPCRGWSAIFGADNRVAIDENSPYHELSRATAIAVLSSLSSEPSPGKIKLEIDSLDGYLCRDEAFAKDYSLSYACTGFLVAPDLLVTAGHCMVNVGESFNDTDAYCKAYSWLFDYAISSTGATEVTDIPADKLYACKSVLYAVNEEKAPFRDYALVRLARPVLDRAPFKFAATAVKIDDEVKMIGYPLGSPAKLTYGAKVQVNELSEQSFITNLDAFEGNSGSPVLNSANEVVGILIAGTPTDSFVKDTKLLCERYNRCDENGMNCASPDADASTRAGSTVERIGPVQDLIELHKLIY